MHQKLHKKFAILMTSLLLLGALPSLPSVYAEETWQWTTPTPGAPNIALPQVSAQETLSSELPISSYTVIINEVFPAGSKTDIEFVELYNFGSEDVNISGLRLVNKGGKEYIFPNGSIIKAKAHLAFKGVLPLTDTAEAVQLMRGTEELDRLEFADSLTKGEMSAGRYCDVYELRFCEVKRSTPTFGFVNALEALNVEFSPKDAVVPQGGKVSFSSNIEGARIILMQNPESKNPDDSKVYTEPFTVKNGDSYWYFAQFEGQATVPKKVTFTVDALDAKPIAELRVNEVMIDPLTRRGWVEVYNSGTSGKDMSTIYIDTRASIDTLCTTCAAFTDSQKIASKGYMLLELPKTTVTQLMSRKTPVEVRLMNRMTVLHSLTMPLATMKGQWRSWMVTEGSTALHGEQSAQAVWTDIPTPGVKNVHVDFSKIMVLQEIDIAILANLVYAQAAYEDERLLVRGKTLPGYTMSIWGNGKQLVEIAIPEDGLWTTSFSYAETKDIPHIQFQLKNPQGTLGLLSSPFPLPAYDGSDPRQSTTKKIMSAGGSPLKTTIAKVQGASTSSSSNTATPQYPFQDIPLLSSMTGVLLSEVPTFYNSATKELSMIPGRELAKGPLESILLTMSTSFVRMFALGLSQ